MDQEFRIFENIVATPQKYTSFKQEFSFGLEWTDLTFKLTHITFNYGAP